MERASRFGSKPTLYPSPTGNDVSVEIIMDGTGPLIGGDAKLSIILKNKSSSQRTASLLYEVMVMYYTGVLKTTLKKDRVPLTLKPQESEWSFTVPPETFFWVLCPKMSELVAAFLKNHLIMRPTSSWC